MQRPNLIIIAGCNGAGKSTYSESFTDNIIPFDFDKKYLENYSSLFDSELRDVIANNMTSNQFTDEINLAFENKTSFCYETNFNQSPLVWAQKAKDLGYKLTLVFFCLENIEIAQKRVKYRTENNGHYVPDTVIFERWKEGYKNLNLHFSFFDYILLLDNTFDNELPTELFELEKEDGNSFLLRLFCDKLPEYAKRRFPEIFALINNKYKLL